MIRNTQTIILARVKRGGSVRHVARVFPNGMLAAYTFTVIPGMTRDEAILDLEARLGHGTFPEVKHA